MSDEKNRETASAPIPRDMGCEDFRDLAAAAYQAWLDSADMLPVMKRIGPALLSAGPRSVSASPAPDWHELAQTERESAIGALRAISHLVEHDSRVYCIAQEELGWLTSERGTGSGLPNIRNTHAMLARLAEWSTTYGAALKPQGADTYGNGVRDCKAQVAAILASPCAGNEQTKEDENVERTGRDAASDDSAGEALRDGGGVDHRARGGSTLRGGRPAPGPGADRGVPEEALTAGDSSSLDDERVAVILAPGGMQEQRVRRMLADVRLETVESCAVWLERRADARTSEYGRPLLDAALSMREADSLTKGPAT